jgi:NAD(P)-dependent dehydrogenase (short-subunit alcohol dehydrogenase family)
MPFPTNPRAVVTGAGSGLGRALALNLARRGGRILVADINVASADETVRLAKAAGGDGVACSCDVTRVADLERVAAEADGRWGGVDILVNNAGVAAAGLVGEQSLDDWAWIVGINLWGVIHGCHVFAPRFRAQRSGYVLNVASAAGFVSLPEMASYNVTKAGVISLSETLCSELGASGVRVSVLCPSFFKTNLMNTFRSPGDRQRAMAENLFRRSRATADEVAASGLAGLEAGRLYIVPHADAKRAWWLKRMNPGFYFSAMRRGFYSWGGDRKLLAVNGKGAPA